MKCPAEFRVKPVLPDRFDQQPVVFDQLTILFFAAGSFSVVQPIPEQGIRNIAGIVLDGFINEFPNDAAPFLGIDMVFMRLVFLLNPVTD